MNVEQEVLVRSVEAHRRCKVSHDTEDLQGKTDDNHMRKNDSYSILLTNVHVH